MILIISAYRSTVFTSLLPLPPTLPVPPSQRIIIYSMKPYRQGVVVEHALSHSKFIYDAVS